MLDDGTMEGSSIFVFLICFFFVSLLFRKGGKLVDEDVGLRGFFRNRVFSFFFKVGRRNLIPLSLVCNQYFYSWFFFLSGQ